MIDLISDTITIPTKEMLYNILDAPMGDAGRVDANGRGEDITTNRLEDLAAELTGKESAAFFPTGTMANTAALLAYSKPGDKILVDERQHILVSEKICFMEDGFKRVPVLYRLHSCGNPNVEEIRHLLDTEDIKLVCIENTHNFSGGKCMTLKAMERLKILCEEYGVHIHLDGARLFNAAESLKTTPFEICKFSDSVMFCISKGLGAPMGSLLCGSQNFIHKIRDIRKLLGGTMRQSGIAAACGIYALQHNVLRLAEDRENTQMLAKELSNLKKLSVDRSPHSNILLFDLRSAGISSHEFCRRLAENGIRGSVVSDYEVRLVFHLGISKEDTIQTARAIYAIDEEL